MVMRGRSWKNAMQIKSVTNSMLVAVFSTIAMAGRRALADFSSRPKNTKALSKSSSPVDLVVTLKRSRRSR